MFHSGMTELSRFIAWLNTGRARPLGKMYSLHAAHRLLLQELGWDRIVGAPCSMPEAVVAGGRAAFRSLHRGTQWPIIAWVGPAFPTAGHLPASKDDSFKWRASMTG